MVKYRIEDASEYVSSQEEATDITSMNKEYECLAALICGAEFPPFFAVYEKNFKASSQHK